MRYRQFQCSHGPLLLALAIAVVSACTSVPDGSPVLTETTLNGRTVTEINLDAIPEEVTQIGLSEFFAGMNVIRLESSREALAMNYQMHFADDFILLGTQASGAARLLRFDYEGNYLNEIGGEGGGPGEHRGIYITHVNYYEDTNTVQVRWDPIRGPQLFRPDGTYLGRVRMPWRQMNEIVRVSEEEWFSFGNTTGRPRVLRDSLKAAFFSAEGTLERRIERTSYPPENATEYTPSGSASLYSSAGNQKIYFPEDHTIYRVAGRELVPEAVIRPGENGTPFNKLTSPENIVGTYRLEILSETDRNWFIKKMIYTEADIEEFPNQPGRWGGRFETREELLVIDKETARGRAYTFTDDVLYMLPNALSQNLLPWQEDFGAYLVLSPDLFLKFQEESDQLDRRSPEVERELEKLNGISADDNFIIFIFPFREENAIE